jgi:hypothetical protein
MRVFLGGRAVPRAEFALFGVGGGADPTVSIGLLLENGEVFVAEDYISLGYTHFEAWCVGAVGGRGGSYIYRPDGWPVSDASPVGGRRYGGSGGGGGLHRVVGNLTDLDPEVEAIVGQAGLSGSEDSGHQPYLVVTDGSGRILLPVEFYQNPEWQPAEPGSDGGFSSFGGDICRASGGKGGSPAEVSDPFATYWWNDGSLQSINTGLRKAGDGGDGGRGDVVPFAGGGAEGGKTTFSNPQNIWAREFVKPKDGGWDGSVGSGGGGGIGGAQHWTGESQDGTGDSTLFALSAQEAQAMRGGRGAFSYADTSVHGPGQPEHYEMFQPQPPGYPGTPQPVSTLTGGTGGGAKINKRLPYGSRALGFDPNGAVYIRIYKVD